MTVTFEGGRYLTPGNDGYAPPAAGGSYSFDEKIITFNSEYAYPAHFNWNLILGGEYEYIIGGGELSMVKHSHYKYDLVKKK